MEISAIIPDVRVVGEVRHRWPTIGNWYDFPLRLRNPQSGRTISTRDPAPVIGPFYPYFDWFGQRGLQVGFKELTVPAVAVLKVEI